MHFSGRLPNKSLRGSVGRRLEQNQIHFHFYVRLFMRINGLCLCYMFDAKWTLHLTLLELMVYTSRSLLVIYAWCNMKVTPRIMGNYNTLSCILLDLCLCSMLDATRKLHLALWEPLVVYTSGSFRVFYAWGNMKVTSSIMVIWYLWSCVLYMVCYILYF